MTKKIIWAIVIVIILVGAFFLFGRSQNLSQTTTINEAPLTVPDQGLGATTTDTQTGAEKDFTVVGTSFAFEPNRIEVNKGDRVRITFKDKDGLHDLKIENYEAGTERLNSGQEQTITFTADKAGTFAFYCSVGTHRVKGMEGKLIVK